MMTKDKLTLLHREISFTTKNLNLVDVNFLEIKAPMVTHFQVEFHISSKGIYHDPLNPFLLSNIFNNKKAQKRFKTLKSLSITFSGKGGRILKKIYSAIISFVKNLKSLTQITFTFAETVNFDWEDLKQISNTLKRLKRLTKFNFIKESYGLQPNPQLEEKAIKFFFSRLTRLQLLENITFEFRSTPLSSHSIEHIFKLLKKLKKLQGLRFALCNMNNEKTTVLCKELKRPVSLQSLALTLLPIHSLNQELFIETFKEMKSISNLEFNDYSSTITTTTMSNFFKGLKELNNLKRLHICTRTAGLRDNLIEDLASSLQRMKKLTRLCLKFDGNINFSEQGLDSISESLKGLSSLRHFELRIPGIRITLEISEASVSKLLKNLLQNESLNSLYLELKFSIRITEEIKERILAFFTDSKSHLKIYMFLLEKRNRDSKKMIGDLNREIGEKLKDFPNKTISFEKGDVEDYDFDDSD